MEPVISHWHIDPLISILAILFICLYYTIHLFRPGKNAIFFWTSITLFFIVECSPLHYLGMHYYFSAHMITHVILLLICGPFLVMSLSITMKPVVAKSVKGFSKFIGRYSWLAWLAGVGIMWLWHVPAIFDATFTHDDGWSKLIPLLHASSMLIAGMIFSWPLLTPFHEYRVHPLIGVLYLFTACISCSLLGLLITFAPIGTYHHYLEISKSMYAISNPWGLTREADQQAAGLIMWVPCCFVYLGGCIYMLYRWFSENVLTEHKNETIKLNKIY